MENKRTLQKPQSVYSGQIEKYRFVTEGDLIG